MSDLLATGLSTAVQNKIEDLVLQGKLQGGDKLNEVELAELFGTSRGPIRFLPLMHWRKDVRSLGKLGRSRLKIGESVCQFND